MNDFTKILMVKLLVLLVTGTAVSKELQMIGPDIPPHFDGQGGGRIGDVISAVLTHCGHQVKFTIVPFGRHWHDYKEKTYYDGLATAEADQIFPGYTTKPFINLQDGATVLTAKKDLVSIKAIDQLTHKHIVSFPNAPRILGIEHLLPKFKSFQEETERIDQIRLLMSGRVDAILADGLITAHFIKKLCHRSTNGEEPDIDVTKDVLFRRIFNPGPQRLYFRDQAIAEAFDRSYDELNSIGEIERIAKPFVDAYSDIVKDQYPTK